MAGEIIYLKKSVCLLFGLGTFFISKSQADTTKTDSIKLLKEAVIKGKKDLRKQLDDMFTTGAFSEPAIEYYDMREEWPSNPNIIVYISDHSYSIKAVPSNDSMYSLVDKDRPIRYFLDEQEIPILTLKTVSASNVAYIKVISSDFLSTEHPVVKVDHTGGNGLKIYSIKTPINVLIYTRLYYVRKRLKNKTIIYKNANQ